MGILDFNKTFEGIRSELYVNALNNYNSQRPHLQGNIFSVFKGTTPLHLYATKQALKRACDSLTPYDRYIEGFFK